MSDGAYSRMERLLTTVEQLTESVGEMTGELRHTNENVQRMTLNVALMEQQVSTHAKEIYTVDNSSRIRTLELQVKGLYAMMGFLCLTIGGQLIALLSHWRLPYAVGKP